MIVEFEILHEESDGDNQRREDEGAQGDDRRRKVL